MNELTTNIFYDEDVSARDVVFTRRFSRPPHREVNVCLVDLYQPQLGIISVGSTPVRQTSRESFVVQELSLPGRRCSRLK